jgi:hypothetical protein
MGNKIQQTVFQVNNELPKRMIVQYIDQKGNDAQTINNYDDLSDEEKLVFDSFKELSESKMI